MYREVYPGQILHVSLVTVGLCGGVSPGTVVVEHDKHIHLTSTNDYTSTVCTTLNYTIKQTTYISNTILTLIIANGDIYNSIWPTKIQRRPQLTSLNNAFRTRSPAVWERVLTNKMAALHK